FEAHLQYVVSPGTGAGVTFPRVVRHTMQAQAPDALRRLPVVGRDHPAFPGGQVLRGIEAEAGEVGLRSDRPAVHPGPESVGRVVSHPDRIACVIWTISVRSVQGT